MAVTIACRGGRGGGGGEELEAGGRRLETAAASVGEGVGMNITYLHAAVNTHIRSGTHSVDQSPPPWLVMMASQMALTCAPQQELR